MHLPTDTGPIAAQICSPDTGSYTGPGTKTRWDCDTDPDGTARGTASICSPVAGIECTRPAESTAIPILFSNNPEVAR